MLYLVYINVLNRDWEGYNFYEFIFSEETDSETIEGEHWNVYPASNEPTPPDPSYVKEVGELKTEIDLSTIQQSDTFSIYDAVDGVVALGWENYSEYEEYPENRLVFNYGEPIEKTKEKLYAKDLVLNFKFEDGANN